MAETYLSHEEIQRFSSVIRLDDIIENENAAKDRSVLFPQEFQLGSNGSDRILKTTHKTK